MCAKAMLLSVCFTAWELQLLKPAWPRASSLQQEKPLQEEACNLELEKAQVQQQRPCTDQLSAVQSLSRVRLCDPVD